MKNKILLVSTLAIIFVFAGNVYAVGQNSGDAKGNQSQQQIQTTNQGEDNQVQTQNNEPGQNGNAVVNQVQSQGQNTPVTGQQNQEQNQGQNKGQQGEINAEQHRSSVANFVQSLLQVADREGGIGEQVRTIAQQQNQSVDITVQAMEMVQKRSRVKTFFFGSDYKNLGALRSEIVQTQNRAKQLNGLIENVQNVGDKTELQSQVQIIEQEQARIENFIKDQEGKFSLFGWFVKLFNK